MTHIKSTSLLILVLAGLLLLAGCSDNNVAAPATGPDAALIAADPLDNVLKSTDGHTPADPQERLARLAEVLGLDEDQLAALTEAYTVFRDGMIDLRTQVQSGDLTMDEARAAAAVLRDAFEAEMQIILTAEQWDILQNMRDEGRHDEGDDDGDHHDDDGDHHQSPADMWGAWFAELGLDADQIAAVLEALDVFHAGMQDLRDQIHAGTLTWEEARTAAEALRADFDAALQTILTEEQYQALLDLRPDCGDRHGR